MNLSGNNIALPKGQHIHTRVSSRKETSTKDTDHLEVLG